MMVQRTDTRTRKEIKNSSCVRRTVSNLFWNFLIYRQNAPPSIARVTAPGKGGLGYDHDLEQWAVTPGGGRPRTPQLSTTRLSQYSPFMVLASGVGRSFKPATIDSFVASSITRLPRGRNRSPCVSGQA